MNKSNLKSKLTTFFMLLTIGSITAVNAKEHTYDSGYEAAWDGKDEPTSFWSTDEEKEGYENGAYDAWMYYEGYDDGKDGKYPKYSDDLFYMDGYQDGKKDR